MCFLPVKNTLIQWVRQNCDLPNVNYRHLGLNAEFLTCNTGDHRANVGRLNPYRPRGTEAETYIVECSRLTRLLSYHPIR